LKPIIKEGEKEKGEEGGEGMNVDIRMAIAKSDSSVNPAIINPFGREKKGGKAKKRERKE